MKANNSRQSVKRFVIPAGLVLAMALLALGVWVYSIFSEFGPQGLLPGRYGATAPPPVHLKAQDIYKIKKKQELMGMFVVRIISKRQPEEFLVVDGVSRKLVDQIYGKKPDLVWANLMANQLLKLRQPDDGEASPVSVEIQNVRTKRAGALEKNKRTFPYWQLEVRFKLSNESEPRYYEAGVIRDARQSEHLDNPQPPSKADTLVIGYAQKEAFQKELVADLLNYLSFENN